MSSHPTPTIPSYDELAPAFPARGFGYNMSSMEGSRYTNENVNHRIGLKDDTLQPVSSLSLTSLLKVPEAPTVPALEQGWHQRSSFLTPVGGRTSVSFSLRPRKPISGQPGGSTNAMMKPIASSPEDSGSDSPVALDDFPEKLMCPELPSDEMDAEIEASFWGPGDGMSGMTVGRRIPFRPTTNHGANY